MDWKKQTWSSRAYGVASCICDALTQVLYSVSSIPYIVLPCWKGYSATVTAHSTRSCKWAFQEAWQDWIEEQFTCPRGLTYANWSCAEYPNSLSHGRNVNLLFKNCLLDKPFTTISLENTSLFTKLAILLPDQLNDLLCINPHFR